MSFIHNADDRRTYRVLIRYICIAFEATFLRPCFLKLQIIRLVQGHQLLEGHLHLWKNIRTSPRTSPPLKKHIEQFILPKGTFCQFFDRKVVGLIPKYYLLAGGTNQVSSDSLQMMIKMSKQQNLSLNYLLHIG